MNWLNYTTAIGRTQAFLDSSEADRGTWFSLSLYCAHVENGGRIKGAASWTESQWQRACAVSLKAVRSATRLLIFEGADVVVKDYPAEHEKQSRVRSEKARLAAQIRWEREHGIKTNDAPSIADAHATSIAPSNAEEKVRQNKCVSGPPEPTPHNTTLTQVEWEASLRKKWPGVEIAAELAKAGAHVRTKRGAKARLSRKFFVEHWLPGCVSDDDDAERQSRRSVIVDEVEPVGWREVVADTAYGPGGRFESKTWAGLSADAKAWARNQLKGES